jgi:hypothetical protein
VLLPLPLLLLLLLLMIPQPFTGPWPLFQFLNPVHNQQDFAEEKSAGHKAATYTQNKYAGTHVPSVCAGEDGSCLGPRGHC